jgi:hypothetical protein
MLEWVGAAGGGGGGSVSIKQEIQITKRKRETSKRAPSKTATRAARPEFLARLKKLYGGKRMKTSGAELLSRDRSRY